MEYLESVQNTRDRRKARWGDTWCPTHDQHRTGREKFKQARIPDTGQGGRNLVLLKTYRKILGSCIGRRAHCQGLSHWSLV